MDLSPGIPMNRKSLEKIDPREQQHIKVLSRVLDHVKILKQNTEGTTVLGLMIASAAPIIDKTTHKPANGSIFHKGHPVA